jgi:hypothetical protein
MGDMDLDIKTLRKLLNSKLFLDKYPFIERVWVDKYGNNVDIVLSPNDTKEYFSMRDEIRSYVWDISKYVGVNSNLNIYP